MKLIFLDFDGVLNSEASFRMEIRKKKIDKLDTTINQTLSHVCCSNFQMILDAVPDAQVVISSAWRHFFPLEWLKNHLYSYYVDGGKVIDKTPPSLNSHRGREIDMFLEDFKGKHPGETIEYVIIDDSVGDLQMFADRLVECKWKDGLRLEGAELAIRLLGGKVPTEQDMVEEDSKLNNAANARREEENNQ